MAWSEETGEIGYLGIAGLFVEGGLFAAPSLLVSMETGFSAIFTTSKDGAQSADEGPFLGIALSFLPGGKSDGVRIGICWDWMSDSAGAFSATLAWLFVW